MVQLISINNQELQISWETFFHSSANRSHNDTQNISECFS